MKILVEKSVIEQALEALVKCNHFHDYEDEITALREALAEQAEQEPVGEVFGMVDGTIDVAIKMPLPPIGTKLYTAPPKAEQEPVGCCENCGMKYCECGERT